MTNDFDDVYWMLDTGFRPVVAESRQYYILIYNHQCLCVTKLGQSDNRDHVNDQYICSVSKSARTADQVCSDPYHINSLKDWITATGVTPKKAAISAINLALADPIVKGQADLKHLKLTFNPIVKFILDCLSYFTHK
jgi:hypothetical protein